MAHAPHVRRKPHRVRLSVLSLAAILLLLTRLPAPVSHAAAVTSYPYAQEFTFVASASSDFPAGGDGSEFTNDSTGTRTFTTGTAGGVQKSGSPSGIVLLRTATNTPRVRLHLNASGAALANLALNLQRTLPSATSARVVRMQIEASTDGGVTFNPFVNDAYQTSELTQTKYFDLSPFGGQPSLVLRFSAQDTPIGTGGRHGILIDRISVALSPHFDADGRQTTDAHGREEAAQAVAIQPDGRIVAAGYERGAAGDYDFAVARYNEDGSPDAAFAAGGQRATDFFGGNDQARALAVQPDGKVVVAGRAFNPATSTSDFALARYNGNGDLDASFDGDGLLTTDIVAASSDNAIALALQPDGRIVVAGQTETAGAENFALARYNPDGSLDTGFDGDGLLIADLSPGDDVARAVVVQQDGRIVVAGSAAGSGGEDFVLARYNADGSPDPSFGSGGVLTTDFFGGDDRAYDVALEPGGKIVAAGGAFNPSSGNQDFALARYNPDGSADPTFDADGRQTSDFTPGDDQAMSVVAAADKIIAVGFSNCPATGDDFALARFNADGSPDASFDRDGRQATNFAGSRDRGMDASLQNGKIVVAGFALQAGGADFALARYQPDGGLDAEDGTGDSAEADLRLEITNSADPVVVGESLTYTVTVTNVGPNDATGVTVADELSADLLLVSADTSRGNVISAPPPGTSGVVQIGVGDLLRGASATINVRVSTTAPGTAVSAVSAAGAQTDPKPHDNAARQRTKVIGIALLKLLPGSSVGDGCGAVNGVVTLSAPAPPGGVTVDLTSTNPAAGVPAEGLKIEQGSATGTFAITTIPVTSAQRGEIRAALNTSSRSKALTVRPGCSNPAP
jgi:uncharacterized delta-60 repeat protein/uncharacterized repeat protein (TIGR01451 family)